VAGRYALRTFALSYLAALLAAPVVMVFHGAFEHGLSTAVNALTTPDALHALSLTIEVTAIAVAVNTVFGVACAIALARHRFPGRAVLDRLVDLPFAVSPVVVGLALILVYGQQGWFGATLAGAGIQVIFSTPGIVIATIFVSLPFVAREVVPVLTEVGTEQEDAARTLGASGWQTFWRVTLPAIRPAIGYGVILSTARALGEFGAVSVVSGKVQGRTETLTIFVQDRVEGFDMTSAYAAGVLLALLAISVLLTMTFLDRKRGLHGY
jgi:sulfate transport system permease protein